MRMRLKHIGQVPYNAPYRINKPELGLVGWGTTFDMLERHVRQYRVSNGIPTGLGFSEELEGEICKLYPDECEMTDTILPLQRRLTLDDVVAGTKVIAAFKAAGSPLVPQAEAERRAQICNRCPLCQPFPKLCAGFCGAIKELIDSTIGGYSTSLDNDARACSICHCFAGIHVRVPYEISKVGLSDQQKAQFQEAAKLVNCWKTEGAM